MEYLSRTRRIEIRGPEPVREAGYDLPFIPVRLEVNGVLLTHQNGPKTGQPVIVRREFRVPKQS